MKNEYEIKDLRFKEIIMEKAARFFLMESAGKALITVTNVSVSRDGNYATIFLTCLPDSAEPAVLDFAKRKRGDFKDFIKRESRLNRIPFFDFAIDTGERNRERIDEITRNV
jgi:ribosome-binding factor A